MQRAPVIRIAFPHAVIALVAVTACARTTRSAAAPPYPLGAMGEQAAIARARSDSARWPYTEADVRFMSTMIHHHAQAIVMAKWAPTHGASASLRRLCERVINAQTDEINLMSGWLKARNQPVPEPNPAGMTMTMGGATHAMLMPGMLSDAQMQELDAARGQDFDRLFLTFMIQHHRGAVTMVQELFAQRGAAVDETVFKFASDVNVDQSTEISRMIEMLVGLP